MQTLAKFHYPNTYIYPGLIVSNQTEVSTVHIDYLPHYLRIQPFLVLELGPGLWKIVSVS